jgi:hypothetical protein
MESRQQKIGRSAKPQGATFLEKNESGLSCTRERLSRRETLALLRAGALVALAQSSGLTAQESAASASVREDSLHFLSLEQVASRLESRALSPVEVTRHLLNRIAHVDGHLKSYATLTPEQALASTRRWRRNPGRNPCARGGCSRLQPGVRGTAESVERRSVAWHVVQWFGCRRCRRSVLRGDRHGYRRFNSKPRIGERCRRIETDVRTREPLRRVRNGRVTRSRRTDGASRRRRRTDV